MEDRRAALSPAMIVSCRFRICVWLLSRWMLFLPSGARRSTRTQYRVPARRWARQSRPDTNDDSRTLEASAVLTGKGSMIVGIGRANVLPDTIKADQQLVVMPPLNPPRPFTPKDAAKVLSFKRPLLYSGVGVELSSESISRSRTMAMRSSFGGRTGSMPKAKMSPRIGSKSRASSKLAPGAKVTAL